MTDRLTPEREAEIRARLTAAEDGWHVVPDENDPHRFEIHGDGPTHVAVFGGDPDDGFASYPVHANAEFAAHAREDVPVLLTELDRTRAELAHSERIRENADFHLGQEMARRQLAEKETTQLRADLDTARQHIAELETYALGCDAEGCTIPHSSWCETAKKTAAANDGCTCPQPWKDSPQPHAAYCWLISPPRNEVEEMRKRVVEVIAKRDEAHAELNKYVGAVAALTLPEKLKVDTIPGAYRNGYIHALADMRTTLEAPKRRTYPPALPWAALMDDDDLAEFLAELEHAIATPGATPNEALTEVEKACGTWRVIAEAQNGHNTAAGPGTESGEGR